MHEVNRQKRLSPFFRPHLHFLNQGADVAADLVGLLDADFLAVLDLADALLAGVALALLDLQKHAI